MEDGRSFLGNGVLKYGVYKVARWLHVTKENHQKENYHSLKPT